MKKTVFDNLKLPQGCKPCGTVLIIGGITVGGDGGYQKILPSEYTVVRISAGTSVEIGMPRWVTETIVFD